MILNEHFKSNYTLRRYFPIDHSDFDLYYLSMVDGKNKRLEYRDYDQFLTEKEEAIEDFVIYSCEMYNIHGHPDSFRCPNCLAEFIQTVDGHIMMIHNEIVKH